MSDTTNIEWCDSTFNCWIGCTKVGAGCDNCYAENLMDKRMKIANWGAGNPRVRTSEANWKKPIKWNKDADKFFADHGRRQRVFCASLADVFDNEVPVQWRIDLMKLICDTPNLDWLILTKRIGNAAAMLEQAFRAVHHQREGWEQNYLPNLWLGATIVNQAEADRDIPKLLKVSAAVRFLSMEPLLEPVNIKWALSNVLNIAAGFIERGHFSPGLEVLRKLDWVIVGGESGNGARPMHPDWARSLRNQCEAAGVPYLFKQWGEFMPADDDECDPGIECSRLFWTDGQPFMNGQRGGVHLMAKVGKHTAGRLLDGVTHDGYPMVKL